MKEELIKIKELLESGIPSEFKLGLNLLCQIGMFDAYTIVSSMKVSRNSLHPFHGLWGIGLRFPLIIMNMLFSTEPFKQDSFPRMGDWEITARATPDKKGAIRKIIYMGDGIDFNKSMMEKTRLYIDIEIQ